MSDPCYHPDIKCFVDKVKGYPQNHHVEVYTKKDSMTDMSGTIEVAAKIDPDVNRIFVFCDNWPEIAYYKRSSGEWASARAAHGSFSLNGDE